MARAGLSHDIVVAEAAAVADEIGWERLNLALIAERLGVKLPSLYKHIASLDGLRRDLAVIGTRELADVLSASAVGRARTDALHAVAKAYRRFALEHPGRYAATVRAPASDDLEHGEAADSVLRIVFAVLAGYGLAGDDVIDATRSLRAGLHGFVALEAGGGFAIARDVESSFNRLIEAFDSAFASWANSISGSPASVAREHVEWPK